jgi:hypothetical protein
VAARATVEDHGFHATCDHLALARAASRSRLPVVNLRGTMADLPVPFIGADNEAIARLGRTIHQEIDRVRIERAETLLAETNLPIKHIAQQSGFQTVQYLTRAFRRLTGDAMIAAIKSHIRRRQDEIIMVWSPAGRLARRRGKALAQRCDVRRPVRVDRGQVGFRAGCAGDNAGIVRRCRFRGEAGCRPRQPEGCHGHCVQYPSCSCCLASLFHCVAPFALGWLREGARV